MEEQLRAAAEQRRASTELALVRKVRELTAAGERMADELKEKAALIDALVAQKIGLEDEKEHLRRKNDRQQQEIFELKRKFVKIEVSLNKQNAMHVRRKSDNLY